MDVLKSLIVSQTNCVKFSIVASVDIRIVMYVQYICKVKEKMQISY